MQKVLSRIIFIGFDVQIVLGILWMCNAFATRKGVGEGIVCVGAILLVALSVVFVKRMFLGTRAFWTDVFAASAVLTFPFVMQTVMNPDRRVVVTVLMLLAVGVSRYVFSKCRGWKGLIPAVCLLVFTVGLFWGAETFGREHVNFQVRFTERLVATTLQDVHDKVPKESRKQVSYSRLPEFAGEVTGIEEEMYPYLVRKLGEEEALLVLKDYRTTSWKCWTGRIIKETAWDAAGYMMSPMVVSLQLSGRGYDSYTGTNCRELLLPAPNLGKFYRDFGCWWFAVAFVCGGVQTVGRVFKKEWFLHLGPCLTIGFSAVVLAGLYALNGAGTMDYKNTLSILCGWLVWLTVCALPIGGNSDAKE